MKRPLLVVLLGFIIGIIWGLYIKLSIVLFCAFFILICFIINSKKRISKTVIITIIISSIISNLQVNYINSKYDNLYKDVNKCTVIATVLSEAKESKYNLRYKVKVYSINNKTEYKNTYLYLYVKKNSGALLEFGDKISFNGIYSEPDLARNYNGFSNKEYLKTTQIYGTIKPESKINILKKENCGYFLILTNKLRNLIINNIKNSLSLETSGFAMAIILGYTDNINSEVKEDFKDSNLSHILALSGMHISYLILGVTIFLNKLKLGKRKAKVFTILFLIFFMILTGFSPSVTRAGIMGILVIGASLCYRKSDIYTSISFSLLISLILNPFSINNIGLLLSYGGTVGIVLFEKRLEKIFKVKNVKVDESFFKWLINKLKQMISVTLSAQIIIAPIMIINFNTISLTFIISNILAGFFIGIILICGYVLSGVSLVLLNIAKYGFIFYDAMLKLFLKIVEFCSILPFSKVYVCTPNFIFILFYYIFILLIYFKKDFIKKHLKKIIIIFLIILIIFNLINLIPNSLKIYFIDVGQGDSTLIVTPNHKTILIDGGGSEESDYDIGENVLIPYLLARGINSLDYIIVSHFDTDHVGGLFSVLEELNVKNAVISKQFENSENYKKFIKIANEKKVNVIEVQKGDKLKIEKDLYFDILWPNNSKPILENTLNNNSIVCKLCYKNFSMFFTGDIEKVAEKQILEEYKNTLEIFSVNILKVGHHGSKTSSIQEFIEVVKPKIALIGVGKNNKFGHPNVEVLERLENMRL